MTPQAMSPRPGGAARRCARVAGFTLVEILVVVVILAIIAALAIPSLNGQSSMEVASAARILAADLEYAQEYAVTSQIPVTVEFNKDANTYRLYNASGNLTHPITKSAYVVDYSGMRGFGGMDIVSASFGSLASVTYSELGTPTSNGDVTLKAGSKVFKVSVAAATGKVTVTEQ
jgi:prepilin-type N-terminal cleavage/methylation domain-containing protein